MGKISPINKLKIQLQKNRLSHAYLIFGEVDVNELTRLFEVNYADLFVIEESPIKINQIRELVHWDSLKPHSSKYKLAIIKNTQDLTLEAANALLKLLEEPSAKTIIILVARKKEKILPTILSRCQIIKNEVSDDSVKPEFYRAINDISRMTIRDRFQYAANIIEHGNVEALLNAWESEFRDELKKNKDVLETLKEISRARSLLKSNISVKLLLENLLLEI